MKKRLHAQAVVSRNQTPHQPEKLPVLDATTVRLKTMSPVFPESNRSTPMTCKKALLTPQFQRLSLTHKLRTREMQRQKDAKATTMRLFHQAEELDLSMPGFDVRLHAQRLPLRRHSPRRSNYTRFLPTPEKAMTRVVAFKQITARMSILEAAYREGPQ